MICSKAVQLCNDCCTCWICDMMHSYMWHNSLTCVTWLIVMRNMTHYHVWHDSLPRVTGLITTCDMTYHHVWHISLPHVTWLITTCDMNHAHVWHNSSSRVTYLMPTRDMTWLWAVQCCNAPSTSWTRGGGLGSRPKKMYGERLGDGVGYHLMSPTPRR